MSNSDMTPEQFCYWLNGHFDLAGDNKLSEEQVKVIREHLELVFNKKVKGINLFESIKPNVQRPRFYPTTDLLKPMC